jgi:hypothetical protein
LVSGKLADLYQCGGSRDYLSAISIFERIVSIDSDLSRLSHDRRALHLFESAGGILAPALVPFEPEPL